MGVNICLRSELEHQQQPGKGCSNNVSAKFNAFELWVERDGTLVVLYRNQWPVNFICILLNCILVVL